MTTPNPPAATSETTDTDDPREQYFRAMDWVADLAAAAPADRMGAPTPCSEYDVSTLLQHLVTTVRRPRAIADGTDPMRFPTVSADVPDGRGAQIYAAEAAELRTCWGGEQGAALLDRTVRVPWGEASGRDALRGYLSETLVHGWDLAVATGQDPEADPDLAEAALAAARRLVPAEFRGGGSPFAPPVPPADGAGPTERLANWSGHRR